MNHSLPSIAQLLCLGAWMICGTRQSFAQASNRFIKIQQQTNAEVVLKFFAPRGDAYRLETSADLLQWDHWLTSLSTGTNQHIDSAAPFLGTRFYRSVSIEETNFLTGDHLSTTHGDLVIHPINHASLIMSWNGLTIYADPVGGSTPYKNLPKADLVLVTHIHGDHFDIPTLNSIMKTNALLAVAPPVYSSLSAAVRLRSASMANNTSTNLLGIFIEAIPAYNSNHPKGTGNGYILNLGGRRIYLTGDTGDIADIRALRNIDVAFVCMNVPFTMSVTQAASVIRDFRPSVVYPYHYKNQDGSLANFQTFRQLLGTDLGIELRLRAWY